MATKHMTVSDTAAAVAVSSLTHEEKIHILRLKGLSEAEAEATLKNAEYIASATAAEGATTGLSVATTGLKASIQGLFTVIKSHPFIAIAAAILSVIMLAKQAADAFEEWRQETIEKGKTVTDETKQLKELISQYKDITSQGKLDKEAREEIKGIQSQIVDLVGEQANSLDLVNGKLDTEQEKIEKIANSIIDMPTLETAYNTARDNTKGEKNVQIAPWGEGVSPFANEGFISQNLIPAGQGKKFRKILDDAMKEYGMSTGVGDYELRFYKINENDFKSRIEAYEKILEELRTTEGFDTESDLFTKLLEQKTQLVEAYKVQKEAADNYLNGILSKEYLTEKDSVDSYEEYLNYRNKLIEDAKNDKKVSEMIEENVFDEESLTAYIDGFLSKLTGFSDYYNKWYDELGSESAKKSNQIREQLKSTSQENADEIDKWFDKLSVSDKDIIAKIDVDTDTAKWKLEDWQKALDKYKKDLGEYVDEANNLFNQLMNETGTSKNPSFVEYIEKIIEKVQKLEEYLGKVENGSLTNKERASLFKSFPQLTAYADDLSSGIENLLGTMRGDVVESFANQLSAFSEEGASDEEIQQLENYRDSVLGIVDAVDDTVKIDVLKSKIKDLNTALSDIKDTYDDVKEIIDDYNDNGYYTIDNLKSLLDLEPEYINALINEKGQIDLNSQAYKDYIAAKAKTLVIDQVKSLYETVLNMGLEEAQAYANAEAFETEAKSLGDLISATTQYYLVLAKAKDSQNNTTAYTDALKQSFGTVANYAAVYDSWLNSLSSSSNEFSTATDEATSALESQKEALESQKDALEDEKDALENAKDALEDYKDALNDAKDDINDLIDLTTDYIKQLKNDEKDALEEQKSQFDDLISKRKEALELAKEEREEADKLADKQNAVVKDKLALAIAQLDDSSAGKKTQKKAAENLKSSNKDLTDYLYEQEYNARVAALEAEQEAFDNSIDEQKDKIDEYLSNVRQLYEDACSMIDNDTGELYGNLWDYTYKYTTQTRAEFDNLWSNAQSAIQRYRGDNESLLSVMENIQLKIYDTDVQIGNLNTQIDNCETQISELDTAISNTSDAINDTSSAIDNVSSSLDGLSSSISDYINQLNQLANTSVGDNANKTSFWVNYNGKKYETGYNYNGDTKGNRLLAASELTKLIAKDVSGFENYGLSQVQALLGVGGNETDHKWTYKFDGKTYESRAATKTLAVADIRSQLAKKYGNSSFVLDQVYGKITGYAEGTKSATGGLHIVDEEGLFSEFIPYQIGKGRYSFLPEGNPVFSKAMTNTLFDFASDPAKYANSIINNSTRKSGDVTLSSAPVYHIYGKVDNDTLNKMDKQERQRYELFKKQFMLEMLREKNNL